MDGSCPSFLSCQLLSPHSPCCSFRTSTSSRRPWRRMPLSCWLYWASGISTATAVRPTPCCPMTSTCTALLPISSRYQLLGRALGGLVAGSSALPCTWVWLGSWHILVKPNPITSVLSTVRGALARHILDWLWACVFLFGSLLSLLVLGGGVSLYRGPGVLCSPGWICSVTREYSHTFPYFVSTCNKS